MPPLVRHLTVEPDIIALWFYGECITNSPVTFHVRSQSCYVVLSFLPGMSDTAVHIVSPGVSRLAALMQQRQ